MQVLVFFNEIRRALIFSIFIVIDCLLFDTCQYSVLIMQFITKNLFLIDEYSLCVYYNKVHKELHNQYFYIWVLKLSHHI